MKRISILFLFLFSVLISAQCQVFPEIEDNGTEIYTNYPGYGLVIHPSIKVKDGNFWDHNLHGYRVKYYATMPLLPGDTIISTGLDSNFECIYTTWPIGANIYDDQELSCVYSYKYYSLIGFEGQRIWFRITLFNTLTGIESEPLLTIKALIKHVP